MEIQNHSGLSVQAKFHSPDLRPDLMLGQVVAKALGQWDEAGRWSLVPDQTLPFFCEAQGTPWGDLAADFHHQKAGCDVTVIGRVYSPSARGASRVGVRLEVGASTRELCVWGARHWVRKGGTLTASQPEPFAALDMTWRHSYGGHCLNGRGQGSHFVLNPDGTGYQECASQAVGQALARIEDPKEPQLRWDQRPTPCNLAAMPAQLPLRWGADPRPILERIASGARVQLPPSAHNIAHPQFRFSSLAPGMPFTLRGMNLGPALRGQLPDCRYFAAFRLGPRRHAVELLPVTLQILPETRHCLINYSAHLAYRWVSQQERELRVYAQDSGACVGRTE